MAKKIRFKLDMGNGFEVNNIEELRQYFNLEKVMEYLEEGKFLTWLKDRYYEEQATAIENLDKSDELYQETICRILEIGWNVDFDDYESYSLRLSEIKKYTNDFKIISQLHLVAFDQFELYDRLDQDCSTIYLLGNSFTIPSGKGNITYIGINNPEVKIDTPDGILPSEKNIKLQNVKFDVVKAAEYGDANSQFLYAQQFENDNKINEAFTWYLKAAEQNHTEAIIKIIYAFMHGIGTEINLECAREWSVKAGKELPLILEGDILYQSGAVDKALMKYEEALEKNQKEAIEHLRILAEKCDSKIQGILGIYLLSTSENKNISEGIEWCKKSLVNGNYSIVKKIREKADTLDNEVLYSSIADIYYNGIGIEKDYEVASQYCQKILEKDELNPAAIKMIKDMTEYGEAAAMYIYGRICCKNESEAFNYIKKAAEIGYTDAQKYMGHIYFGGGYGQQRDFSLAARWYEKSGDDITADTARNLGNKYGNHGERL